MPKKDPQNGDYSFIISNQKLYEITRTVPLQDFIDKQFLKFQGHVTRLQNNKLQKQLQFMIPEVKNTQNLWNKCAKLLGGYDGIQTRRLMQSRAKFKQAIDSRGMEPAEQSKPSETLLPANYHCHCHCNSKAYVLTSCQRC